MKCLKVFSVVGLSFLMACSDPLSTSTKKDKTAAAAVTCDAQKNQESCERTVEENGDSCEWSSSSEAGVCVSKKRATETPTAISNKKEAHTAASADSANNNSNDLGNKGPDGKKGNDQGDNDDKDDNDNEDGKDDEEVARRAELVRQAEAARQAQAARLAEAVRQAQAARLAEAARQAQAARLAFQQRRQRALDEAGPLPDNGIPANIEQLIAQVNRLLLVIPGSPGYVKDKVIELALRLYNIAKDEAGSWRNLDANARYQQIPFMQAHGDQGHYQHGNRELVWRRESGWVTWIRNGIAVGGAKKEAFDETVADLRFLPVSTIRYLNSLPHYSQLRGNEMTADELIFRVAGLMRKIHGMQRNARGAVPVIRLRNGGQNTDAADRSTGVSVGKLRDRYGALEGSHYKEALKKVLDFALVDAVGQDRRHNDAVNLQQVQANPRNYAIRNPSQNQMAVAYRLLIKIERTEIPGVFAPRDRHEYGQRDRVQGIVDYQDEIAYALKALTDKPMATRRVREGVVPTDDVVLENMKQNVLAWLAVIAQSQREYNANLLGADQDSPACPHGNYNAVMAGLQGKHDDVYIVSFVNTMAVIAQKVINETLGGFDADTMESVYELAAQIADNNNWMTFDQATQLANVRAGNNYILFKTIADTIKQRADQKFMVNDPLRNLATAAQVDNWVKTGLHSHESLQADFDKKAYDTTKEAFADNTITNNHKLGFVVIYKRLIAQEPAINTYAAYTNFLNRPQNVAHAAGYRAVVAKIRETWNLDHNQVAKLHIGINNYSLALPFIRPVLKSHAETAYRELDQNDRAAVRKVYARVSNIRVKMAINTQDKLQRFLNQNININVRRLVVPGVSEIVRNRILNGVYNDDGRYIGNMPLQPEEKNSYINFVRGLSHNLVGDFAKIHQWNLNLAAP